MSAMTLTNRVALNTLVQGAGYVVTVTSALALTVILTRALGTAGYGDYTVIFTYLAFFGILGDFGVQTIAVGEISKRGEDIGRIAGSVLLARVLQAIVAFSAADIIVFFLPYSEVVRGGILLASLGSFLLTATSSLGVAFHARLKLQYPVASNAVARLISLAITAVIAFALPIGASSSLPALLYLFIGAQVVSWLVGLVITFLLLDKALASAKLQMDLGLCKQISVAALSLGLAMLLEQVHFKADTLILSLMKSSEDVGVYSVAYRVLELSLALPGVFMVAAFPVLARYAGDETHRFGLAVQRCFDFMVMIALPLAGGVVVLAPGIVMLLGGAEFLASVVVLRILAFAILFLLINSVFSYLMIAERRQKQVLWVSALAATVNVGLNLALIPAFGYLAAAGITVFTEFVATVALAYLAFLNRPFSLGFGLTAKVILATAVMVLVLAVMPFALLLAIPLGIVVYFAALYLLRGLDVALIRSLLLALRHKSTPDS